MVPCRTSQITPTGASDDRFFECENSTTGRFLLVPIDRIQLPTFFSRDLVRSDGATKTQQLAVAPSPRPSAPLRALRFYLGSGEVKRRERKGAEGRVPEGRSESESK
jgi:hypothetical protein